MRHTQLQAARAGEITLEMKFTDSMTGQLLAAALDRRVGGKNPSTIVDVWANADEALQFWSKLVAFRLCTGKQLAGCVNPND